MLPAATVYPAVTVPDNLTTPLDLTTARGQWKFMAGDDANYQLPEYDDSAWCTVPSLPHNWKDRRATPHSTAGFGWYRIHLHFGETVHAKPLIFRLGPIDDADEVYFNGTLIGKSGEINASGKMPKRHAWDRVRMYPVPPNAELPGRDNVLAIRVQAYFDDYAGMYYDGGRALLGYEIDVLYSFFIENMSLLIFVVIIIIVGLYCLLLFFRRPTARENLFFGLSCVLFGVYFTLSSSLKNFIPFDYFLLKRIEFFSLFLVLCMFANYIYMFFYHNKIKAGKFLKYLIVFNNTLAFASVLVPLFSGYFLFWWWYFNHIVIVNWAFCLLQILWIIAENIRKKDRDAYYMLAGVVIGMAALVNDALSIYAVLPWGRFGHLGYFVFIIFLGIVLANRYVRTQHEIERLNVGLEQLVKERTGELQVANEALTERTIELSEAYGKLNERNIVMEDELEIARLIMDKLLPQKAFTRPGYLSHMAHIPMDKVGGDFYNYSEKGDTIELFIADVSGHGLPGAFLSLITKITLENVVGTITTDGMMILLNDVVCRATVKSNYITSFFCSIDTRTNMMSYCNAGHFPPLIYRPGDDHIIELKTKGNPLGLFTNIIIENKSLQLQPGDRIVLYTDGIIECMDPHHNMFGIERLIEFIRKTISEPPALFTEKILDHLKEFSGSQYFEDDLTLVLLDVL